MAVQLDRLQVQDEELRRVQDRLVQTLNPVLLHVLLGAQIVEGVVLNSGAKTDIDHKLGRRLRGWQTARVYGTSGLALDLYDGQNELTEEQKGRTLRLYSANPATVDLLVY